MTGHDDMGPPTPPLEAYEQDGETARDALDGPAIPQPTHPSPQARRPDMEGPRPLIRETPPPAPYPIDALGPLRKTVEAMMDATKAPAALCAGSALAAASLATQGLRDVEALAGPDDPRPLSLFLMTLGDSGERKTRSDKLAMKGVSLFESASRPEHEVQVSAYERRLESWKAEKAAILKSKDETGRLVDLEDLGGEPEPPLEPDIICGDATVEGLLKRMPVSRASLGWMTDEGGLVVGGHSMRSETRLNGISTIAKLWDGAALSRTRASGGKETYRGRRVAMHLMMQPSTAAEFLSDPLVNGQGLLGRFLTCRPESNIGRRPLGKTSAETKAVLDRFADRVAKRLSLPLALAEGRRNELNPPMLTLSEAAYGVLAQFYDRTETGQIEGGPYEAVRPFASKVPEHAARLAGVLTVFDNPDATEVSAKAAKCAVKLAGYYLEEAVLLHAAAVIPERIKDAERMRKWLLSSWKETHITARDATQWGPFKVTDRSRAALVALEEYGWLQRANGVEFRGAKRREAWRIVRGEGLH